VSETFLDVGAWLAVLVVLDAVALLLLRSALHVGLLEEAGEQAIGPEIRCANCGAMTASHTFCGNCGIALRALPSARTSPEADGEFSGRLSRGAGGVGGVGGGGGGGGRLGLRGIGRVAAGVGVIAAGGVVAFLVVLAATPAGPQPPCRRAVECGAPPSSPRALAGLLPGYSGWQSTALGYSLRWITGQWTIASQTASDVVLESSDGISQIALHAAAAPPATPATLIAARRAALQGSLLGLSTDTSADDQVLGTNVGLVPGPGAVYRATTNLPQAPDTPVSVAVMAARAGPVAVLATVITPANNAGEQSTIFGEADDVLDSIQYRGT
jgi:hypothetical protein